VEINRENSLALLKSHLKNENLIKHCLASEAVLRALAIRLGADAELWGAAGLLHDIDVELTGADLNSHGKKSVEILKEAGYPAELIDAVRLHNEQAWPGEKRTAVFHKALAAGETITGMITAVTLVYPDKKLASVKAKSVTKRMKETRFAASVNRDIIRECTEIGIPLEEFAELSLSAMLGISDSLGL
jgi:putative nucleotidyltransferase with HDIG domain